MTHEPTVNRWIVKRRMAEAFSLLLETEQSVDWIAATVDYLNSSQFFRQFRQFHETKKLLVSSKDLTLIKFILTERQRFIPGQWAF